MISQYEISKEVSETKYACTYVYRVVLLVCKDSSEGFIHRSELAKSGTCSFEAMEVGVCRTDRKKKESNKICVLTVIEIITIFILLKRYLNYVSS